jgi:hypothetical protein
MITTLLQKNVIKLLKLYENENKFNNTMNRIGGEKSSILDKQDQQYFAQSYNLEIWWDDLKTMMFNFDIAFNHYVKIQEQKMLMELIFIYIFKNTKNTSYRRVSPLACRAWKRI